MAARVASSPQFAETDDGSDHFVRRIQHLLISDVIRIQGKASSIGTEHERVFLGAQVLTDLRPLFGDDSAGALEPEGALLTHVLSIHFVGSAGTHDNFFVVLDDHDIGTLHQAIERATRKATSLKHKLQESGLVYITSEE